MGLVKVGVKVSNKRLQLVFSHRKKRYYYSPGYPDTAIGREYAKLMASKIQEDILKDRFTGLDQYRESPPEVTAPAEIAPVKLADIWAKYLDYIRPQRSPSTMGGQYRWYTRSLNNCPYDLVQAPKIRDWALANHTPDSARRWMVALNACCKWAVACDLLHSNPLEDLKIPRTKKHLRKKINPFTAEERDRILQVLEDSDQWWWYRPIIAFMFFTGCRISEAIALDWAHISSDQKYITFQQAAVVDELGRLRIKQGLKTQGNRRIKIGDRVRDILGDRGEGLVFPSPRTSGVIDLGNFASRIWKPALVEAGVDYRNLYQCRHTFITLALKGTDTQKGLSVQDVAELVGNTAEIIYRSYAGVSVDLELPEW